MKSTLVISSRPEVFQTIKAALQADFMLDYKASIESALDFLKKKRSDLVFLDLELFTFPASVTACKKVIEPFWQIYPSLEIVIMAPKDKAHEAVRAVKAGANDYLTYPVDPAEVKLIVDSMVDDIIRDSELEFLRSQFWSSESQEIVRTRNDHMLQVLDKIRIVAPTKTTVLLTGESGTGKSLLARLIHSHSNRAETQFINVHCGSIPDSLIESELFGHERGAFTGADRRKLGKFEIASKGTIFLDEIGTITPALQIKLLQVLQDATFSRVGGELTLETDVRVIAATNSDLGKLVEEGRFRKDLFYRVNVFPIEIPPLKNRPEDIAPLVEGILNRLNQEFPKNIHDVHPQVMDALKQYPWPGNIRELENVIERAYLLETSGKLMPDSFPAEFFKSDLLQTVLLPISNVGSLSAGRQRAIEDFERQYLKELIARNKGKINKSAQEAGIGTRQLHKLMLKYGIRKEAFKT
jgi:DNA-binding NtrC family response regulator